MSSDLSSQPTTPTAERPRRLIRLPASLFCSLLAVAVVVASMAGVLIWRMHHERAIEAELRSLGAAVATKINAPDWLRSWISDDWLVPFARIHYVNFNSSPMDIELGDDDLKCLEGLTELERLALNRTDVTDAGIRHLKGIFSLKALRLVDTNITDEALDHLAGLRQLEVLSLKRTSITDDGLKHLRGLTKLQVLDLTAPEITDAGLEHLKCLKSLGSLYLREAHEHRSHTKVTQSGVDELKRSLPGLRVEGP